jgi:hypothetical protein
MPEASLSARAEACSPIKRLASQESAADAYHDDGGSMSAQEQAALRSALRSETKELVVHSEKTGGGIEPVVGEGVAKSADFAAMRAAEEQRQAAAHAKALQSVRYPRKYRATLTADFVHTIARREANAGTKPGVVPWTRPPAKPVLAWDTTQIDEDYVHNGPAPPAQESQMLRQSRPYFQTVDPVCAKILSQPPQPQDYALYRHFEPWDANTSQAPGRMGTSSSRQASSKMGSPVRSIGTPASILRPVSEDPLPSTMHMRTGNPAAFKIKDFEHVWGVDTALLVADKHTASGAQTFRDGFRREAGRSREAHRPQPLRLQTASSGSQHSSWSQLSPRSAKPYGLGPRSPLVRELALAVPRAKARGRDDIPLVASPPGSRGPMTHGSMVHAGPRTVKSIDGMYATIQMNARGTQYASRNQYASRAKQTDPTIAQKTQSPLDALQESTPVDTKIQYVNLHTFDEEFASPQRLTPVSARCLKEEGLDTGMLRCFVEFREGYCSSRLVRA